MTCPDGKLAVSGGASVVTTGIIGQLVLESSVPLVDGTGWSGRAAAVNVGATGTLTVYAVCASGVTRAAPPESSDPTD